MLQVKSFNIGDEDGINALLRNHNLAAGASILVSNGEVCIPYEDGEPKSKGQKIVEEKEHKHKTQSEYEVIEHSQKVLMKKANGAKQQLADVEEKLKNPQEKTKEGYDVVAVLKERKKTLKDVLSQFNNLIIQNQAEMTNKLAEIEVHNETIKELEA